MRAKKNKLHPDKNDPPRRRANKARGMGTFENDRPPVLSLVSRQSGEHRYFVCDSATKELCHQIIHENVPADGTILYTDGLQSYRDALAQHAWVNHSIKEWARDDMATECAKCIATHVKVQVRNAKGISSLVVRRMCFGAALHSNLSWAITDFALPHKQQVLLYYEVTQ